MRHLIVLAAGLLCSAAVAFGATCPAAGSIEDFLSPNSVVFMGNVARMQGKLVYQVSEMLWGDLPGRQSYGRPDLRLYAIRLDSKGNPVETACEPEGLPLDSEWITDIRRALQIRLPANLTIRVRTADGSSQDIEQAEVTLSGNGRQYRGRTGQDGRFQLPSPIPPGPYRLEVKKPGYAAAEEPIALVPGGGGEVEVILRSER